MTLQTRTINISTGLLVTHLSLTDLSGQKHGIYQRLSIFVEAASTACTRLRIFCLEPSDTPDAEMSSAASRAENQIKQQWGIDCEVIVGRWKVARSMPWIISQLLGVTGYSRTHYARNLLDEESVSKLQRAIEDRPAFIIAHRLLLMSSLVARRAYRTAPIFFDLDDIEHLSLIRSLGQGNLRNRIIYALYLPGLLWAEVTAIARAHCTYVCSQTDAGRAWKLSRRGQVKVLPNSIAIPAPEVVHPSNPVILMVGIYSYEPNGEGADHFISNVFPLIRQRFPAAEAWFVGKAPESLMNYDKNIAGVKFMGFVDDIGDIYRRARVVICPILRGSGTRIKLVEAAAWSKAIVTTTIGAEGLDMLDGHHAMLADTAADFADRCVTLLADDALCNRLGENARALAAARFDRKQIVDQLARDLLPHAALTSPH